MPANTRGLESVTGVQPDRYLAADDTAEIGVCLFRHSGAQNVRTAHRSRHGKRSRRRLWVASGAASAALVPLRATTPRTHPVANRRAFTRRNLRQLASEPHHFKTSTALSLRMPPHTRPTGHDSSSPSFPKPSPLPAARSTPLVHDAIDGIGCFRGDFVNDVLRTDGGRTAALVGSLPTAAAATADGAATRRRICRARAAGPTPAEDPHWIRNDEYFVQGGRSSKAGRGCTSRR